MGPGLKKLNTVSNWLSATSGVSYWNYTKPLKLNFMMLEHEFWAMGGNLDFRLVDQGAWADKPLIKLYNGGQPPAKNVNHGHSSNNSSSNIKNLFFDQSVRDHHYFLDELRLSADNSANNWKVFDYISYYWNPHYTGDWGTKKHYQNLDLNDPTITISNFEEDSIIFGNKFGDFSKTQSDAIFLVYYRSPSQVQDFQLGSINDPWVLRLRSLMINSLNAPANIIPLFSSEVIGCNIGYDWTINPSTVKTSGSNRHGAWLGGTDNLKKAETYYYDDHTIDYSATISATCAPCYSGISIVGMGWYQLSCILASENNVKGVMTGDNSRLSCGGVGGSLSENPIPEEKVQTSIFPNPTNGILAFSGDVEGFQVLVYNQQGQIVIIEEINSENKIDLSGKPSGIYYVSIPRKNFSQKIIITKQL